MGIISWIVLGLMVGVFAKWAMPGKDPGGIFVTMGIGIAGAFLGGFVAQTLGIGSFTGFDPISIIIATGGAIVILFGYRALQG